MADFQMDNYHYHTQVPGEPIAKANTGWIWKGFFILLVVTAVEVGFAFLNDAGQGETRFLSLNFQKWLFIALTLVKAYFIVFSFMHLGHEKFSFKLTISLTMILILYFIALMMIEGYALRDVKIMEPDFFKRTYKEHHAAPATDGDHADPHAH